MRILKIILILLLSVVLLYCAGWIYLVNNITKNINYYANKPINLEKLLGSYNVSFSKLSLVGFPFKMEAIIHSYAEETKGSKTSYLDPIRISYSLSDDQFYIRYNGDVTSSYKPVGYDFGVKIQVEDFLLAIKIPIGKSLFYTLSKMKDPFEIVNHIKECNIITKKVKIFDIGTQEQLFDKDYESLKLIWKNTKWYLNINDFLYNIPQQYSVSYQVKTNSIKKADYSNIVLPKSLFSGVFTIPNKVDLKIDAEIKTSASYIKDFLKNYLIALEGYFKGETIEIIPIKKIECQYFTDPNNRTKTKLSVVFNTDIEIKEGFGNKLLSFYNFIFPAITSNSIGKLINNGINYMITNKDFLHLPQLENTKYNVIIDLNSDYISDKPFVQLNDFSFFSNNSGIKLTSEIEPPTILNPYNVFSSKWITNGRLYIQNYCDVVDFFSRWFFIFGKYRHLSQDVKAVYSNVNKIFLKIISDYPKSISDDVIISYNINSQQSQKSKIGSVKIKDITVIYESCLYNKFFEMVGGGDDALTKIKKLVPYFDINDRTLQNMLLFYNEMLKNN